MKLTNPPSRAWNPRISARFCRWSGKPDTRLARASQTNPFLPKWQAAASGHVHGESESIDYSGRPAAWSAGETMVRNEPKPTFSTWKSLLDNQIRRDTRFVREFPVVGSSSPRQATPRAGAGWGAFGVRNEPNRRFLHINSLWRQGLRRIETTPSIAHEINVADGTCCTFRRTSTDCICGPCPNRGLSPPSSPPRPASFVRHRPTGTSRLIESRDLGMIYADTLARQKLGLPHRANEGLYGAGRTTNLAAGIERML